MTMKELNIEIYRTQLNHYLEIWCFKCILEKKTENH